MLHLYIEGQEVAISSDISFQYVVENIFVTEAEGYSLSIEVDITAGKNMDIFGLVTRMDADIDKIRYNAHLISPQYCAYGVVAIIGISEKSLKLQFLQGKSCQNFNERLDETYINELDLGTSGLNSIARGTSTDEALKSIDAGGVAVALPWVISSSGETIHNRLAKSGDKLIWHSDTNKLSFMPYMIVIAKRICEAIGFSYNFSEWENSEKRHLLICNAMPESLGLHNFAYPLPHWTVYEFFSNIEFILEGKFEIDEQKKSIIFNKNTSLLESAGKIFIEKTVDEFTVSLDADPEKEDRPEFLRNRGYESNSGRMWNVRNCDWYIRQLLSGLNDEKSSVNNSGAISGSASRGTLRPNPGWAYESMMDTTKEYKNIKKFMTMTELLMHARQFMYSTNLPGSGADAMFYSLVDGCFFCLYAVKQIKFSDIPKEYREEFSLTDSGVFYENWLTPVNDLGDYILDDRDEADRSEMKVAPVAIDIADGLCCFLPFSESSDDSEESDVRNPKTFSIIKNGDKERPQYYDKLYLGFWDGVRETAWEAGLYPLTSNISIYNGWYYERSQAGQNLRLNNGLIYGSEEIIGIDYHKTYKISFLSESIPDAKAIFIIKGKRYLCKKLTAEFSTKGMNNIIQGEFFRIDR